MDTCDACNALLTRRRFVLCRSVEVTRELDAATIETEVLDSLGIGEYCEACGSDAALKVLVGLGLTPIQVQADPPTPLCSKCQGKYVLEDRPHVVYMLEHDEFCADGSVDVLAELYRAPVCMECEPLRG
jgi:hypothetical protein